MKYIIETDFFKDSLVFNNTEVKKKLHNTYNSKFFVAFFCSKHYFYMDLLHHLNQMSLVKGNSKIRVSQESHSSSYSTTCSSEMDIDLSLPKRLKPRVFSSVIYNTTFYFKRNSDQVIMDLNEMPLILAQHAGYFGEIEDDPIKGNPDFNTLVIILLECKRNNNREFDLASLKEKIDFYNEGFNPETCTFLFTVDLILNFDSKLFTFICWTPEITTTE